MEKKFNDMLQDRLTEAKQIEKAVITPFLAETWKDLRESTDADMQLSVDTSYDKKKLIEVGKSISTLPSDMNFFKKSEKLFSERLKMIESEVIDW